MKLVLEITSTTTEEQLKAATVAIIPLLAILRSTDNCTKVCGSQVTEASSVTVQQPADVACRECGFYSPCKCEELGKYQQDVVEDCDADEQLDTAAIFGNSPLNALSTAGAEPSATAPITTADSDLSPASPTNAASAGQAVSGAPLVVPPTNPAGSDAPDINGVYWDARIHSRTKAKLEDGSWRKKRGAPPELVAQVVAEQKAGAVATPATAATVTPPATGAVVTPPAAAATVTPPVPAGTLPPFPLLMRQITAHIKTDDKPDAPLTYEQINFTAAQLGLVDANGTGTMGFLATKQELIPAFRAMIDAILAPHGRVLGD